jgi:hypothetical protein
MKKMICRIILFVAIIAISISMPMSTWASDQQYVWHTFYGGGARSNAITTDSRGNIYIAGYSVSSWQGPGDHDPIYYPGGASNLVVVKLDSNGNYIWHTYFGSGSSDYTDEVFGIALDAAGNIYVTGDSEAGWNAPGAEPLHAFTGTPSTSLKITNAFILKLDNNGAHKWHTFYGTGTSSLYHSDHGNGITTDAAGNVYVTGHSWNGWNGPATGTCPVGSPPCEPLNAHTATPDTPQIFVLKLDGNGSYKWHTFFGNASGLDLGKALVTDSSSNVYVTGFSNGYWQSYNSPLNPVTGIWWNMFILKLNSSGAHEWHTFYGSDSGHSETFGIALDSTGNIYAAGYSGAGWNGPLTGICSAGPPCAPLNPYSSTANNNLFAIKLDSSGAYQWHTFYSSNSTMGDYSMGGLAVDSGGAIALSGNSLSSWTGPSGQTPDNAFSGGDAKDIFALKLGSNGAYIWHTFYGSNGNDDMSAGLGIDENGNAYTAGYSSANWTGPGICSVAGTSPCPLNAYSSSYQDIVVLKLAPWTCSASAVKIQNSSTYSTIHDAYTAASSTDSFLLQAATITEPTLSFSLAKNITLHGGYECGFVTRPGRATILGSLTIKGGSVIMEKIIIK